MNKWKCILSGAGLMMLLVVIAVNTARSEEVPTDYNLDFDIWESESNLLCGDTAEMDFVYDNDWLVPRLPWALLLANKYNSPKACYIVYETVCGVYCGHEPDEWSAVSETDAAFALHYLFKAAELGDSLANATLTECPCKPLQESNLDVYYYCISHLKRYESE